MGQGVCDRAHADGLGMALRSSFRVRLNDGRHQAVGQAGRMLMGWARFSLTASE